MLPGTNINKYLTENFGHASTVINGNMSNKRLRYATKSMPVLLILNREMDERIDIYS
jgi:hypothetical protein